MRTVQRLIGDVLRKGLLAGHYYTRAVAIDDVLDIVRALLYEANSHDAELKLIESLREPMGRVDR